MLSSLSFHWLFSSESTYLAFYIVATFHIVSIAFCFSDRRKHRQYGPVSINMGDERIHLMPDDEDEEEDDGGRGGES